MTHFISKIFFFELEFSLNVPETCKVCEGKFSTFSSLCCDFGLEKMYGL